MRPGDIRKAGLAGPAQTAIARAAKLARSRSRRRFDKQLDEFLEATADRHVRVEVVESPGDPAKPWWPATEVGLLVPVEDLLGWFTSLEAIISLVPEDLNQRGVSVAPVRNDRLVGGLVGRLINRKWFEFSSALDGFRNPGLPSAASTPTADAFSRATGSLTTISALIAWDTPDHTHAAEQSAFDDAKDIYASAVAYLQEQDQEDPVIREAFGVLVQLSERVQDEIDHHVGIDHTLAAELSRVIRGVDGERFTQRNPRCLRLPARVGHRFSQCMSPS